MNNSDIDKEKYFTISTPRKDGSILTQFLTEFGYQRFEVEEDSEETSRRVKQESSVDELVVEVLDFCKENKCKIKLFYIVDGKQVEHSFQSEQSFKPKVIDAENGNKTIELEKHEDKTKILAEQLNNIALEAEHHQTGAMFLSEARKQTENNQSNQRGHSRSRPYEKKPTSQRKPLSTKIKEAGPVRTPIQKEVDKKIANQQEINARRNAMNPNHPTHPDNIAKAKLQAQNDAKEIKTQVKPMSPEIKDCQKTIPQRKRRMVAH